MNFETYAAVELIESHKTKDEFLKDYKIYCELLRDLANEAGIPVTLDTSANAGIKTHRWCTDVTNTYGGHVDPYPYLNKWGVTKAQFASDIANATSTSTAPSAVVAENPVKATIDVVNLNSQAFNIKGWLLHKKNDLKGTTPWVFFVDEKNKEIARFKGTWTSRPDVSKVYPNPQKDNVGVNFSGKTPDALLNGGKFRIMLRASDDKVGNVSYAENWFDSNYDQAPKVDTGNMDKFKLENGKLHVTGWHLSTKQSATDKHFLIFMDKATNKELTRVDITKDSFKASTDVRKVFSSPKLVQADKCRFDTLVTPEDVLKNKNVYVISRYCTDPKGNNGVTGQYSFKDTVIFI